jgi:ribosome-binding factor A
MGDRTARLDELLREEISAIITRDVHDPRVGFVTVTGVDVTRDLSHATVWVSLIGQPDERKDALRALGRAMPFVRARLGVLRIRKIPELHLRLDDTAERGTRVLDILNALEAGRDPGAAAVAETLPTPIGQAKLEIPDPADAPRPKATRRPRTTGSRPQASPRSTKGRR